MKEPLRRISLMIGERQHKKVQKEGLNISALVRDLLSDHFSDHKVVISVSKETHDLYQHILSHTGAHDSEIEPHLKKVLQEVLSERIKEMSALRDSLSKGEHNEH